MFKFGVNFNLTPCFFLEISLNSCLMYTARPAFYRVNGQSSRKICFKYVFDIIHCVFLCGSVDQKITRKAGSSSSGFGWFVFFFPFFSVAVESFCLFFFCIIFVSSFVFPLFPLLTFIISELQEVLWYTYFSLLGEISYGYIW